MKSIIDLNVKQESLKKYLITSLSLYQGINSCLLLEMAAGMGKFV